MPMIDLYTKGKAMARKGQMEKLSEPYPFTLYCIDTMKFVLIFL